MQLTPGIRRFRRRIGGALLPLAGAPAIRLLARTWHVDVIGGAHLADAEREPGRLIALWHGRMVVGLIPHEGRGYTVLVSASDDGDLSAALLPRFGYRVVRGSTSRGGTRALREMVGELRRGGTIVVTPDGPRGPRHAMNVGLAWMSRATGFPVVPGGFVCDRGWHTRSWDHFTVPRFGARLAIVYGEPVSVAADAGDADLERETEEIRRRMLAAEAAGFAHLEVERDW